MNSIPEDKSSNTPRVLMYSHRNIYEPEVWRSSCYEFEEIIRQIDSVEILAPRPGRWFHQRRNNAMRVGKYSSIILNPGIPIINLDKYYDLFFAICERPSELLNINSVERWKDYCKTSICWVAEFWAKDMPLYKSSLKVLSKFDYVVINYSQSVGPLSKVIAGECSYMPPGADAILFCPDPKLPNRPIDVFSFGRRWEETHQAFLKMAKEGKIFYVYDTLKNLGTLDLEQHRFLVANLAKRSRYIVVNPGKFNSPNETGSQSEIGARFVEGAAAGAILIGEQPKNEEFSKLFFWPDAVVSLPRDGGSVEGILTEMDRQPDRQEQVRRTNLSQSLLRHDWVYRWEAMLKMAGLEPMPALLERKKQLSDLSKLVEGI
jgi:hypothetical protein